jgi:outer membrane lipoprotein-sorting protein
MSRGCMTALLLPLVLAGQDARSIVAESQKRTEAKSQVYQGSLRVIDSKGKVTDKRWTYERFGSHGQSKSVLRFVEPPEVRGVALLVVNHTDRASDQWMWIPEIGRERRVALQDRSTRFFGTDFTFEDLEERDVDQYTYRLLGEEKGSWKIESKPKKSSQYTHSYVWIRKADYAFARVENYRGAQLIRELDYSDIRAVDGIPTAHRLEMHDVGRNSRTILVTEKLRYNTPLAEERFTLQSLKRGS